MSISYCPWASSFHGKLFSLADDQSSRGWVHPGKDECLILHNGIISVTQARVQADTCVFATAKHKLKEVWVQLLSPENYMSLCICVAFFGY